MEAGEIAQRVAERRKALGLSRQKTAKLAGLGDTYLRDLEEGRTRNPRVEHLSKLAPVLQTTVEWLAHGRGAADVTDKQRDLERIARVWDRIAPADRDAVIRTAEGLARRKRGASED